MISGRLCGRGRPDAPALVGPPPPGPPPGVASLLGARYASMGACTALGDPGGESSARPSSSSRSKSASGPRCEAARSALTAGVSSGSGPEIWRCWQTRSRLACMLPRSLLRAAICLASVWSAGMLLSLVPPVPRGTFAGRHDGGRGRERQLIPLIEDRVAQPRVDDALDVLALAPLARRPVGEELAFDL